MNFASDNCAPVHPRIMAALIEANDGAAASYGRDDLTRRAEAALRDRFEAPDAAVFLLGTGTGANALALAQMIPPFGRIFCHQGAHIETSELGAPGFMAGGAMTALIGGEDGRITPKALAARLADYPQGDAHDGVNAALSLTNATELGTVYGPRALAALAGAAHDAGLAVHVDGARFANAVAHSRASPAALSGAAGVDALSLGGTKCGCMALELVIFFDPDRAARFEYRRMRAGHLVSKHRYLAAQMLAWLADDLWLGLAAQANAAARALAEGLGEWLIAPVEANEVFVRLPADRLAALRAQGLRAADWGAGVTRLVTSWATTEAEIAAFHRALA